MNEQDAIEGLAKWLYMKEKRANYGIDCNPNWEIASSVIKDVYREQAKCSIFGFIESLGFVQQEVEWKDKPGGDALHFFRGNISGYGEGEFLVVTNSISFTAIACKIGDTWFPCNIPKVMGMQGKWAKAFVPEAPKGE
jgi:hypothetical protein